MTTASRKLSIFLCHASQDKPMVRELYQRLLAEGWIDPWLDEEKLLPGQNWDLEIEKAVEAADAVAVCLSSNSVSKEGYIQRELRFALDIALEKPEDAIFIIPIRLSPCEVPRRIKNWHYVDFYPDVEKTRAYEKIKQSLFSRARTLGIIGEQDNWQFRNFVYLTASDSQAFDSRMPKINPLPDDLRGKIAFLRGKDNNQEYVITNADGSGEFVVARASWSIHFPRIAPGGDRVVFVSAYEGRDGIYTMNRDGSNIKRLTGPGGAKRDGYASWSPDGTKLVYVREYSISNDICVMDSDGNDQRNLTNIWALGRSSSNWFSEFPWSPDGQSIVFSSNRDGFYKLYIMDSSRGNFMKITQDPATDDYGAAWSPNGDTIAFVSRVGPYGDTDIFALNLASSNPEVTNLTNNPCHNTKPVWSPDGKQILFVSDRNGGDELYIMNNDGSHAKRITHSAEPKDDPSWLR